MVRSLPSICKNGRHMKWKQISSTKAKSWLVFKRMILKGKVHKYIMNLVVDFVQVIFFTFIYRVTENNCLKHIILLTLLCISWNICGWVMSSLKYSLFLPAKKGWDAIWMRVSSNRGSDSTYQHPDSRGINLHPWQKSHSFDANWFADVV